jgi:hypothetical protein
MQELAQTYSWPIAPKRARVYAARRPVTAPTRIAAMPKRPRPSPDDDLAPQNYPNLNRVFYAAKPADYFGRRLANLMLTAGRAEDLDRLMDEGLSFRGLKTGTKNGPLPEPASGNSLGEERAKAAEHFVTAEAEVLFHHTAETLLRLYLAHEFQPGNAPPCPWLEISRERSFSAYKAKVAARFGSETDPADPELLNAVARVFHLVDDPTKLTGGEPVPMDEWRASVANIEGYLRGFAGEFLKRAPLYNAAKHGLALRADEGAMKLGDGALIKAEGPMIQVLEVRDAGGRPRWAMAHHFVKPDRQMALTYIAIELIERLWETARIRYLPDRPDQFQVRFFTGPSWLDLHLSDVGQTGGFELETMTMDLLYYRPLDDAAPDNAAGAARGHD